MDLMQSTVTIGAAVSAAPTKQSVLALRSSIIIVNYNGGDRLISCIESVVQASEGDDEIILVDNASTDSSTELIAQRFPSVRILRSETNLGFAAGNNLGAEAARGDYLAFLNPDTVVEPGWLSALIAGLDADPRVGLATAKILLLGEPSRINTCGNEVHLTGLTLCRGTGMDRSLFPTVDEVGSVSGAAFAMRRSLFEALGGFDERFFLYMEDTDLSWRARLTGYRTVYVPNAVVYHDYTLRLDGWKLFFLERNRYLMLLKSLRWRTLLVLVPTLALGETITWGFVLLRPIERLGPKLRAYGAIAQNWRAIAEARQRTQQLRCVPDAELLAICTHRIAYTQTRVPLASRLAHLIFNPTSFLLQRLTLLVTRW